MLTWHFREHDPHDKAVTPQIGEYFNTESLDEAGLALLRETIQNSLDAKSASADRVRIRVFSALASQKLRADTAANYLASLLPHLRTSYPNIFTPADDIGRQPCSYIVLEDFGTTGLTGDFYATRRPTGNNNFWFYFHSEGDSGKGAGDRGRWGIGKYTAVAFSRTRCFFALTVREDDASRQPLLMGQAVLRPHAHPSSRDRDCQPYGWLAVNGEHTWLPFDDESLTTAFRNDWGLSRTTEPGLSVVVPHARTALSRNDLARLVISEYATPILMNKLEVELSSDQEEPLHLNEETIESVAEDLARQRSDFRSDADDVHRLRWMLTDGPQSALTIATVDGSPSWSRVEVPADTCSRINHQLEADGRVLIRVPVIVHQFTDKGQDVRASEFHVGLFNQSQKPSRQAKFLREELIVSDAGKGMARVVDVRAIVVIPAGALGDLLGDAENPAHTTWDPKRDRMSKWQFGGPWITFVRQSPKKILEAARGINRDIDRTIAADWFPDLSSSGSSRTSGKDQGRIRTPEVPPIPPPREPIIKFSQISGGFVAVLAPTAPPISTVDISFAYDRQRGNPLKNWSPDDFVLEDLEITLTGGTRVAAEAERDSNHVTIAVTHQRTFRLEVRGFDKNRDVIAEGRYA